MASSSVGIFDQVVLLLTSGVSADAAERFCISQKIKPAKAKAIVVDARNRITVAADFNREEQLGLQITRLEDLYKRSIAAKDFRTAMTAVREKSKLLRLYQEPESAASAEIEGTEASVVRRQLQLICDYLLPLRLCGSNYPIEEHARVASEMLRPQCVTEKAEDNGNGTSNVAGA